jgi:predicted HTH domain antitoxin
MEAVKVKKLSIPIEDTVLQTLDEVAGYYALSRPRLVQKLLAEGLYTARLDHAAGLYARREVTLERAAGIAGVSIYEMMAYVQERDIPAQRRSADIRADAAAMLIRHDRPDIAARLDG